MSTLHAGRPGPRFSFDCFGMGTAKLYHAALRERRAQQFHLAVGTHPFESGSIFETLKALNNQTEPPAPSLSNAFVPAHLDAVILRMLAKDPSQRPAASEVAKQLELRRAPAGGAEFGISGRSVPIGGSSPTAGGAFPQVSGEAAAAQPATSL